MISKKLVLGTLLIIAQCTFASTAVEKKLFTMEKNYNAENIMIINTLTDDSCKFVGKNNEYIDFYWMMNRKNRKEIHSMIRSSVKEKVKFVEMNSDRDSFKVRLNDLSELKHDLEDTTIEISSEVANGSCQVKSVLKLGASAKYRKLNLKRSYCEVSTNLVGIPNGCKFIELEGIDADSGEALKVRFKSKS